MDNKDLLKELESLKKRVSELESLKKSNLNMFGRSYSLVGTSNSDFLIKTRGQVKIQWGNKFIDLIKEGKINSDTTFIFTVKSEDKIGVKDGIYCIDNGDVYLKIGGKLIPLVGEVGTTYVSFLKELETDSNSKYTALKNIGFIYPDISSFGDTSLQNGVVYIESEHKLYIVLDGQLSEFSVLLPNPFTELFIILKTNSSEGAILIKGSGIANSLAFDSFYIFTEEGNTFLKSDGEIKIDLSDKTYINITKSITSIKNIVESNTFQSEEASQDNGFMLYLGEDGSTLIVDNLIVRNSSDTYYPTYWSLGHNIILSMKLIFEDSSDDTTEDILKYAISLKYENKYKEGDYLYLYRDIILSDRSIKIIKIPVIVTAINESGIIYVQILKDLIEDIDNIKIPTTSGGITFLIGSKEKLDLIKYSEHNIDLISCQTIEEEQDLKSILVRCGDLTDLQLKYSENNSEVEIVELGLYAKLGYFKKVAYVSDYELLEDDDSTKMASTEWTRKLINNIVPKGAIMAFHGDTPPAGWAVCDGANGTPNLIGKFIKGGTVESEGDEIDISPLDIQIETEPQTIKIDPGYYSLVFIMKIQ